MIDKRVNLYKAVEFENIRGVFKNAVEKYPDNNAFIIKDKNNKENPYKYITYKQMDKDVDSLGTALIDLGLKNKRVAIIGNNKYEWIVSYLAVVNGTGIVVPLDKGLPEQEIESSLARSETDCLIFDEKYADIVKNLISNNNTKVTKFICMQEKDDFINLPTLIKKGGELLEAGNKEFVDSVIDADAMSILLFTSGTTSLSKAVMLSHRNIASNIYAMALCEDIRSTDTNMAFLPFHHTFGCTGILVFLGRGATNVFCDGLRYIQKNLVEYKVSMFVCVPLLIEAIYKKIWQEIEKTGQTKKVNFGIKLSKFLLKFKIDIRRKLFKQILDQLGGKIRCVISGASGLDKTVAEGFRNFGVSVCAGYGLTETAPVVAAENIKYHRTGSVGLPMPGVEVKIDNPNDKGIGELVTKGPNVMLGYYNNKEATDEVLKDGWFYTGDLAKIDDEGYIYIVGRKKNVIVLKNGKNVYPEELEEVIGRLPYVKEVMVFGKEKDDDLVVSAKIVYNADYIKEHYPDAFENEEKIHEIVWNDMKEINQTVPNYKHIKNIIVTDEEMIKTTTAKVKRYAELAKDKEEKKD